MKVARILLSPLALISLVACGGGGSTSSTPPPTPPSVLQTGNIKMQTGVIAPPKSLAMDMIPLGAAAAAVTLDPSTVQLDMSFAASQSGAFVAGNSTIPMTTVTFNMSTVVGGVTVGSNGVSQTFQPTDLSILPGSALTGPATTLSSWGSMGLFMAQFSAGASTVINMTPRSQALTTVDEIVVRLGNPEYTLADASGNQGTLECSPHFIYNGSLYCANQNTLNNPFGNMQYILFIPASKIGRGVSFFVPNGNSVDDPIANGTDVKSSTNLNVTDPSTWVAKDPLSWAKEPGCAGLASVIDQVAGSDRTTAAWLNMAKYFQAYFIKFYAAYSTMFNMNGSLGNLGGNSAAFEIISLDDSTPMTLTGDYTLKLNYDPAGSTYTLDNGVLTLMSNPPLNFTTTVSLDS